MRIEPYLAFDGKCDEVIEFYKKAVGAKVTMLMRFKECPDPSAAGKISPGMMDKVMHSSVRIGDSTVHMTDGGQERKAVFSGISLSLSVANDAEAERVFAALGEGGKVMMPMGKTFFSSRFGMVTDRFGVGWMVLVQA
jgi:PhnB protein